jgi:mRNA interferase RelE/StbE
MLDQYTQRMIKAWIDKNLVGWHDPRQHGKGLTANRSGQWRYRIGDYRLICLIEDDKLIITALNIGHRKEVYK